MRSCSPTAPATSTSTASCSSWARRPPRAASPRPQRKNRTAGASVTVLLDGRSQTFVLPEDGASILDATLRYRADAPFACKNGVCGTCRAKVVEGKVRMDANYALEPADVAAGYALACQSHPAAERVVLDFDQ